MADGGDSSGDNPDIGGDNASRHGSGPVPDQQIESFSHARLG
jgi:hypothetical protein